MPDYGHALEFGTFLTPANADPRVPVDLAVLSEELGYDLVTFQDHPYQPGFLDTWTLLSWVAARTEKVRISGNVLNLQLRPPAVLARAAASLDLLSQGRFELGLGAGAFADAVAGMGGRKLTAGQAVGALEEGIEIIRGIWDVGTRDPLRVHGAHHRVDGAKRGPAPAHDIGIWLGAYKPRMLSVVGRLADGWLPSLSYLQDGALAAGNIAIDAAATAAGRDPREIRRLLNINGRFAATAGGPLQGPPQQWIDELLPMVLQDGISTFILGSDDPATLQVFAHEVMPALRTAVTDRRGTAGSTRVRPRVAVARRVPGIDYDAVPQILQAAAVEPGDGRYPLVQNNYLRGGTPGLVLPVSTVEEVVAAVRFARTQDVPLGVRSGGHGISGRSTNHGGIVIDLGALNRIEILDTERRLVRIGPGARWAEVATALAPQGWGLTSGDYGGVGVGGLATAGGVGFLGRDHGLTIDHLRAAEIVLADGRVVRASATENADLFWAVRGAGGNVGIVTAFEFEVDEVGEVGWAQLVFDASNTADFLVDWAAWQQAAPLDVTSFLLMGGARRGQPMLAQTMTMVNSSDPDTIIERLQPLAAIAPLLDQSVSVARYADVMNNAAVGPHRGQGEPNARSGLLRELTPAFAAEAAAILHRGDSYFFSIRAMGGAIGDVDPDETAFPHRDARFSVAAFGSGGRLDRAWTDLGRHFDGLYLSFESDTSPERIGEAFPPATLARLRRIKDEYDPSHLFRDNFWVGDRATTSTQR